MSETVKIQDLPKETNELLRRVWKGHPEGFAKFGEHGYIFPMCYKEHADALRRMTLRPDDTWVVTFPRCGTTWSQELVWLLKNDLDYEGAKVFLTDRYYFIEIFTLVQEQRTIIDSVTDCSRKPMEQFMEYQYKTCENAKSPRFLKTHLPFSLLPPSLLDTCKVVYVARDPRDVAISFYHLSQMFTFMDYTGDFKSYWDLFIKDLIPWTPYMAHLKEAWNLRSHPNMMFLFYEDMVKDLPSAARKVSTFLGKEYSEEQLAKLCEHLDIKNFKNNESVNPPWLKKSYFINTGSESFVRKGKAGGWCEYFDDDMLQQAESWMQLHLADTGIAFHKP